MKTNQIELLSRGMIFKLSIMGRIINLHYPDGLSRDDVERFVPTEKEVSEFLGYEVICSDIHKHFTEYVKVS